jgi:fructose-1,6-bisphosphatase/inositol monophosphatase family enzyme
LNHICNKVLSSRIFPPRLKDAEVRPLFKKGDKKDMSNYRPMSLLTAFSKVIEKVIYARLYQHLINHNILMNEQFGFRAQSSTEKATLF